MNEAIRSFTGGELHTNAYLLPDSQGSYLCIDAPRDLLAFLQAEKIRVSALFLTHGHFDHVWDAGLIQEAFACPVFGHPVDFPMINDPRYVVKFGVEDTYRVPGELTPLEPPEQGTMMWSRDGQDWLVSHVPGHCPGSLSFYSPKLKIVLGGDVLFASAVGRWDLPGGNYDQLMNSIRTKFLTLPPETVVYPGHGPSTTIGVEATDNPYLR